MTLRRILLIAAVVLLLPVLAVAAVLGVAQSEWGERWLEHRIAAALDREVQIEGIGLRWGWPPGLVFARLRIANPEWAETEDLIDAEGLYARVRIAPLFARKVVIPYLGAQRAQAGLEMDGARATWKFGREEDQRDAPSRIVLAKVYLEDGEVRFRNAPEDTDVRVQVTGSAGEGGELRATGEGTFRGQAMKAQARIPGLSPQHEAPLQVDGTASFGRTRLAAAGTFSTDGEALDLRLRLSGPSLADLSRVTGMVLPKSPPYDVAGRLRHEGHEWIFDPFDGKVGDSDLRGSFVYAKPADAKPAIRADIKAKLLDFDDLGPLVGAPPRTGPGETAAPEQKAQSARRAASERLLPEKPFEVEAWGRMDADVRLVAEKIQRPKQLPLEAFSTHLVLKDSVLTLDPLHFGMAGGRIDSTVKLDARRKPVRGELAADVKGLQLSRLFPASQSMQDALGTLYGRTELVGTGQSVAQLLGTSNGKASMVVEGGRVSRLLMELVELDVAALVMLFGGRHEQERLRCAVSGFEVRNGVAQADSFVIDSEETVVRVEGSVSLAEETLALTATPNAKHQSLVSLRTPIKLQGPMRDPKVRPEAGPLVRKGALALGLGAINPALAVFALYEPARGEDQPCAGLIAEAKARGAGKAKSADDNPQRAARSKREAERRVAVSEAGRGAGDEQVARKK